MRRAHFYNPRMKTLLDLLPLIAFGAAYYFGGIYAATIAIVVGLLITVIGFKLLDGRWHKAHLIGLVVSVVLGGITLFLHDPAFIKLKPSIVYGIFAIALLGSHFIGDKVLLQRLPQKMLVMPDAVWKRVNLAWALFRWGSPIAMDIRHRKRWKRLRGGGFHCCAPTVRGPS